VALSIAGLAVVLVVVTAVVLVAMGGDDGGGGSGGSSSSSTAADPEPPPGPSDQYGVAVGSIDAPRTVVVYEDFLCPPCGQFHRKAGARLRALADDGEIVLVLRPVDFLEQVDVYSSNAASALFVVRDAAGDEVAADFQGLLLDEQPPEDGPYPSADDLVALAVRAGAEEGDVRPGIEGGDQRALVDEATQAAQDDESITSVPSVLVDGEPFPNPGSSVDELTTALLAELE
jgi:protein-disulfide isomerase